jgi:putative transposase
MVYRILRDKIEHDYGLHVNDKRMLRICRKKKVCSIVKGRHNRYIRPAVNSYYITEKELNRNFHADRYNQKWVTDITEFKYSTKYGAKKTLLSTILDLCNRRPVDYVIGDSNNYELAFQTFDRTMAVNPSTHLLVHSDCGFQYTNINFKAKIEQAGLMQSVSCIVHCLDNGFMKDWNCNNFYIL